MHIRVKHRSKFYCTVQYFGTNHFNLGYIMGSIPVELSMGFFQLVCMYLLDSFIFILVDYQLCIVLWFVNTFIHYTYNTKSKMS